MDSYKILMVVSGGLEEFIENTLKSIDNCNINLCNVEIFAPRSVKPSLENLQISYPIGKITVIEDITNQSSLEENDNYYDYGTDGFGKFTIYKWIAIKSLLNQGICNVIYTDVDIAWRQNPIELLQKINSIYDLAIQTEGNSYFPSSFCTGFMSFTNTEFTHNLINMLIDSHSNTVKTNSESNDQIVFNDLVRSNVNLVKNIFPLSEVLFSTGLSAKLMSTFDERLNQIQAGHPNPFIFHANWTVGLENKKKMLQITGNWFLSEIPISKSDNLIENNNQMDLIQKHYQFFPINQGLNTLEIWHTFDQLLGLQLIMGVKGDVLEIGVLEGATISFLTTSLQDNERAFLIDPYQNVNKIKEVVANFAEINPEQIFGFQFDSKFVAKHHAHTLGNHHPSFRFIHIDGEHSYDAVYSDINLSCKYLAEGGLIVLDDIFNVASACCTQAMFDYLRDTPNLHCVAIGFNKAYLCESKYLSMYRNFFLHLPELLESEAGLSIRLCFNSWAYERSYLTFHNVNKDEPKYQVIGEICSSLEEVFSYLELNT